MPPSLPPTLKRSAAAAIPSRSHTISGPMLAQGRCPPTLSGIWAQGTAPTPSQARPGWEELPTPWQTLVMGAGAFAASPPLPAREICTGQITSFTDTLQRGSPASRVRETWAVRSRGEKGLINHILPQGDWFRQHERLKVSRMQGEVEGKNLLPCMDTDRHHRACRYSQDQAMSRGHDLVHQARR